MAEQDIKMDMKKILSDKGEMHLFNAIMECIDAEIDLRTLPIRPSLPQEQVEERASKAKTELYRAISALEWRHK